MCGQKENSKEASLTASAERHPEADEASMYPSAACPTGRCYSSFLVTVIIFFFCGVEYAVLDSCGYRGVQELLAGREGHLYCHGVLRWRRSREAEEEVYFLEEAPP